MINTLHIADSNVIVAVLRIAQGIRDGFYITEDIAGYPVQLPHMSYITLFAGDKPEITKEFTEPTIEIAGYDFREFLLDVQQAVLQGYALASTSMVVGHYNAVLATKQPEAVQTPTKEEIVAPEAPKATKGPRKGKGKGGDV